MTELYRQGRFLTMRPPLEFGGHCFTRVATNEPGGSIQPGVWYCHRCHRTAPDWALDEGFWAPLIGRWCPGLLAALTP